MSWFKIEGYLDDHYDDYDEDAFTAAFIDWCEEKNLHFIGVTEKMGEEFNK